MRDGGSCFPDVLDILGLNREKSVYYKKFNKSADLSSA